LQIWDTAGEEKFRALGPLYYRSSRAAIAVYDVTNRVSFDNLGSWVQAFLDAAGENCHVIIVANKVDLKDAREVNEAEGETYARRENYGYFETSAFSGLNVVQVFGAVAEAVGTVEVPKTVMRIAEPAEGKQKCC
jgi:small GTP-binding protein